MRCLSASIKVVVVAFLISPERSTRIAVAAMMVSVSACSTLMYRVPTILYNESALVIPAGAAVHVSFEVGTSLIPEPICRLTGRIVGLAGGNKDFDVLLLEQEPFEEWEAGRPFRRSFLEERKATDLTLDVTLRKAGAYELVISNRFSRITDKTVQAEAVLNCGE